MKTKSGISISPRALRALPQCGFDGASLSGSGPNGRILEADVLRATAGSVGQSPRSPLPPGSISTMRRAVAAKVAESFATVPHFYLKSEVDVTSLVQLREQNSETIEKHCGVKPSLTDFLLRAMALALRDNLQANRIWQNGSIVQLPDIDVGLVVQLEDGLMVPILRRADSMSLTDIARKRIELTEAIRSGRTPADIFQGGATSLTNLGNRRVDEFAPIISPPQSSMLAVGRLAQRPAAHEGKLCLRHTLRLTLSVDHRVMDGVPAAAYLDRIAELLEKPFLLFCDMSSA